MRSLSVVVDVGSSSPVRMVRERLEGGWGGGASDSPCVHFAKDHSSRFDQAERGVNGKEFTGGAGLETVSIIHAETICAPR